MKKTILLNLLFLVGAGILGCQQNATETRKDIISEMYPEEQARIEKLLNEIFDSGQKKDLDRLASYHLYGPKFTEFKNGRPRQDAEAGEKDEREIFSAMSDFKYNLQDIKVNVFGDVAIATFHGDFGGWIGQDTLAFKLQSTLVFVKDGETWKIAHEHFSPLNP
jgi:ketosteroid isomerase-like protein